MSTELSGHSTDVVSVTTPLELLDVRTGELVPATPSKAVELLGAARDYRQRVLNLVKDCEAVLLEESRRLGSKTLRYDGVGTAEVTGGSELEWDLETLLELRDLGLPEERYDELVVATVTYKVDARVAKQLEGANESYAAVIERARTRVEKPYRVRLK